MSGCATFVILQPGRSLGLDEVTSFLAEKRPARFKLPERLEVVDDFPLSRFGKVAKNVLSEIAATTVSGSHAGRGDRS